MVTRCSNSEFLTVLDPLPLDNIGWEAVAYEVDPDGGLTVMQRVYRSVEMSGSKVRNDFGSGSIVIPKDDSLWDEPLPAPLTGTDPLDREFLWQLYEDGVVRHEFFGEDLTEDIAVEGESPRMVTISGRTPDIVLEWGVHVPAWAEVQEVTLDDGADSGSFILGYGPYFSDTIAHDASAADFKTAILASIPSLDTADLEITKTVDSDTRTWTIRFVGQFIVGNARPEGFRAGRSTVMDETSGVSPQCSEITQVDFYADDQPRTAASAFLDCLVRCQDRGVLGFLVPLFSSTTDSFGEAWIDADVIEVTPGETLLSLLQRFSEAYGWEFRVVPGFRLQVVQDGFGLNRSNEVRFWLGGHQIQHSLSRTTRETLTRVWAQTNTNMIASASGASSSTALARERWIDGFEGTISYASQVANMTLAQRISQVKLRSVKFPYNVDADHRLFEDFSYCDWIGIEDDRDVMHVLKIESVAWKVGSESPIDFEVTFLGE